MYTRHGRRSIEFPFLITTPYTVCVAHCTLHYPLELRCVTNNHTSNKNKTSPRFLTSVVNPKRAVGLYIQRRVNSNLKSAGLYSGWTNFSSIGKSSWGRRSFCARTFHSPSLTFIRVVGVLQQKTVSQSGQGIRVG